MTGAKAGAILSLVILSSPLAAATADLTIMVEDAAPPFSQADGTGFANDVIKAAFRASGVNVTLDVVPYARCKKTVEDGKVAACASMSWYQEVETKVMFSSAPIFVVYADIFYRKSSPRIARMTDIKPGSSVGIINEYEYPESIYELGRRGVIFQTSPNDDANLKMLARGRLDAVVVMTNDLEPQAQKVITAGVAPDIEYGFRGGSEDSYIGFSKKHPLGDAARQQFDAGYKKILADGTLDAIKKKWTKAR